MPNSVATSRLSYTTRGEEATAFCARMPPENPDRTDAAEERFVADIQGIEQLW